jgi:hypothetical protein
MGIIFHDVPQDGMSADFHHWLGANVGLFGKPGTNPAGQQCNFHKMSPITIGYLAQITKLPPRGRRSSYSLAKFTLN